jgi:hypothetical protein
MLDSLTLYATEVVLPSRFLNGPAPNDLRHVLNVSPDQRFELGGARKQK